MAVSAYYAWVDAGRPVSRPRWLTEIKALAREHGVPFLGDLGNDAHLQTPRPQDHTPFSVTEYPVQISGWWINAIDLGAGPWVWRILDGARAGRYPWLKYMNAYGQNWSRARDGFRTAVANADAHLHLSGMTNHLATPVGANPFVATAPPPAPAPIPRGTTGMTTIYHKGGTGTGATNPAVYAMAGESPGTPANWLETVDYEFAVDLVLIHHPERYSKARTLSPATWDAWKAAYLAPVSTDELEPVEPAGAQPTLRGEDPDVE